MQNLKKEAEHAGPFWKHPYFLYILMTVVLSIVLGVAALLALSNDWIPHR